MMRCLILGGGGFIGTNLCEALAQAEHEVRVFDRPNLKRPDIPSVASGRVEWQEGDFGNVDDVAKAITGCEVVFDLIGTTTPKTSNDNPAYDVESNLLPTVRMLDAAKQNSVRKVIFVSSGGTVYGVPRTTPIAETHETNPLCSYGIIKLATEKYLQLFHHLHGLEYTVLRVSNPYGEHQRVAAAQGAVAVFLNRAIMQQPVEIWGDGSVVRDFIYVGDVVRALMTCVSYQGDQRVFNVGSGVGLSLNDLLAAIERLLGRPVQRAYLARRPVDVPVNILDTSLAARELGWRPETEFGEGLRRTLGWIQRVRK